MMLRRRRSWNDVLGHEFEFPTVPLAKLAITAAVECDDHVQFRNDDHELSSISSGGVIMKHTVAHSQVVDMPAKPVLMFSLGIEHRCEAGLMRGRLLHPLFAHDAAAVPGTTIEV